MSRLRLRSELCSLGSRYIVDEREMWLAAILPTADGLSPHLLVYSNDAGKHWRNLVADDPKSLLHGWRGRKDERCGKSRSLWR